jgi:hypothetical protein
MVAPVDFGKNSPSRYAVVHLGPPLKLVATTWFKQADLAYYLDGHAGSDTAMAPFSHLRILDFKGLTELHYLGNARFETGPGLAIPP